MTTERRRPTRGSRLHVSPVELRLYVVALLGAVFTLSWRAIGGHAVATESQSGTTGPASEPQPIVWIDALPPEARPQIAPPPGWQRTAEPPPPAAVQPARVVRVPGRRAPRVRTRSS